MSNSVDYPSNINGRVVWAFRLVNKRTGRVSSATNSLLDLAAVALELGHGSGIASLLPIDKARKLLRHNKLRKFRRQNRREFDPFVTTDAQYREKLQEAFPLIKACFVLATRGPSYKQITRKQFISWLMTEIQSERSPLCKALKTHGHSELIGGNFGRDWWKKQLQANTLRGRSPRT